MHSPIKQDTLYLLFPFKVLLKKSVLWLLGYQGGYLEGWIMALIFSVLATTPSGLQRLLPMK
jgi:hypothetical protein